MSNMSSVRTALQAEMNHAREGVVFFSKRVAVIEAMLIDLNALEAGPMPTARKATSSTISALEKPGRKRQSNGTLPATGTAFWAGLLSDKPVSNVELLDAAIKALNIQPGPDNLKKMKQRLANAITLMTKDGSMKSDGSGRARRFTAGTSR